MFEHHYGLSVECPPEFFVLLSTYPTEAEGYMRKWGLVRGRLIFVMSLNGSGRPGSNLSKQNGSENSQSHRQPEYLQPLPHGFVFILFGLLVVFVQCSYLPNKIGGSPKYLLSMAFSFGHQISES